MQRGVTHLYSVNLTSSITAIANTIACKLNADEMAILASILVQLGDTLATISITKDLCKNENGFGKQNL